jgi:hypothetical protein
VVASKRLEQILYKKAAQNSGWEKTSIEFRSDTNVSHERKILGVGTAKFV